MSEERIEILRMVADGVINVEEAERLIKALGEGDERRRERKRTSVVESAFEGVGEAFGAIGQVVQSTVEDAMEGVEIGLDSVNQDDEEDGVKLEGLAFEIPLGGRVSLRQRGRTGRLTPCSLLLLPTDGDTCLVEAQEDADVRAYRKGSRTRIWWKRGALTVRVPKSASGVDAKVLGGDLSANALACSLSAQVLGGRMELRALQQPFECKVMGGDVRLSLSSALTGHSSARTVGGNLVIEVPEELRASISASSTGGEVRAEEGIGKIRRDGGKLQRRTLIELGGGGEDAAEISLKTIGGEVFVRRSQR